EAPSARLCPRPPARPAHPALFVGAFRGLPLCSRPTSPVAILPAHPNNSPDSTSPREKVPRQPKASAKQAAEEISRQPASVMVLTAGGPNPQERRNHELSVGVLLTSASTNAFDRSLNFPGGASRFTNAGPTSSADHSLKFPFSSALGRCSNRRNHPAMLSYTSTDMQRPYKLRRRAEARLTKCWDERLVSWTDEFAHLEDRQEHANRDAADGDAQENDQQRLDQRSQP